MRLIITKRAKKDLAGLDKVTRQRITEALDKLITNPLSVDFKKLKGYADRWRLRVGDWRVIFKINENEIIIAYALRVKHRREVYRR